MEGVVAPGKRKIFAFSFRPVDESLQTEPIMVRIYKALLLSSFREFDSLRLEIVANPVLILILMLTPTSYRS
jgi:hypothetical protein